MMKMAAGSPLDQQREERWPGHTRDTQPKVEFLDWEEDSDLSDMEGIFGSGPGQQPEADDDDFD